MGIRKKEMSTAFLGARGEGVLRVYIKIKDGPISGRVVGAYQGIKFSFTNRWPKNRGDLKTEISTSKYGERVLRYRLRLNFYFRFHLFIYLFFARVCVFGCV